jgi:hypothetical protein
MDQPGNPADATMANARAEGAADRAVETGDLRRLPFADEARGSVPRTMGRARSAR